MAMHDSRMSLTPDTAERCMVSVGSSMSGLADVEQPAFRSFLQGEEMRPWTVLEYPAHAATSHVAIEIGSLGGPQAQQQLVLLVSMRLQHRQKV